VKRKSFRQNQLPQLLGGPVTRSKVTFL
jgi:hypothetical protein